MSRTDTHELALELAHLAIDRLGTNVRLIDLRGVVSYTDFFIVVTGQNTRQTKAIAEHISDEMRQRGNGKPRRREADPDGTWLLLDYVDVVVHVFTEEARQFYRLENLWGQVPQQDVVDPAAAKATASNTRTEVPVGEAAEVDAD